VEFLGIPGSILGKSLSIFDLGLLDTYLYGGSVLPSLTPHALKRLISNWVATCYSRYLSPVVEEVDSSLDLLMGSIAHSILVLNWGAQQGQSNFHSHFFWFVCLFIIYHLLEKNRQALVPKVAHSCCCPSPSCMTTPPVILEMVIVKNICSLSFWNLHVHRALIGLAFQLPSNLGSHLWAVKTDNQTRWCRSTKQKSLLESRVVFWYLEQILIHFLHKQLHKDSSILLFLQNNTQWYTTKN